MAFLQEIQSAFRGFMLGVAFGLSTCSIAYVVEKTSGFVIDKTSSFKRGFKDDED